MSTRPTEVFPERLRQAREVRKLSQSELSERSGLQASAISHFENGVRKPSFDNLRRLADALNCTTDFLLGRASEISAIAGADKLNRHARNLSSSDLEIAEEIMKVLASRTKEKGKGGG